MNNDYYSVLGVEKNASQEDIKKALKKMAAKYHPDKAPDHLKEEYTAKFQEIRTAGEFLSDEDKRAFYDNHGPNANYEEYMRQQEMASAMGGFFNIPGFGGAGVRGGMNNMMFNPDVVINVTLSLNEIYTGKTFSQEVTKTIVKISGDKQERTTKKETHEITIEPGTSNGHKIYLRGMGNVLMKNDKVVKTGNIIVLVQEIEHPIFKRSPYQPLHIYMNQKISVFQALLGEFDFSVTNITGEKINITLGQEIIKPGTVLCILKKGLKCSNKPEGNLYVIFDIEFPNQLTEQQRTTLSTVADYVSVKNKKKSKDQPSWNFTDTENLQRLLNTNDNSEGFGRHQDEFQQMQCSQQ